MFCTRHTGKTLISQPLPPSSTSFYSRVPSRSQAEKRLLAARLEADYSLAQRCIQGDVASWNEIYARYHDRLCRSIQIMLGPLSDGNLVDEIAARVWYCLVADDGKMLERYTPTRKASLITFMRLLARDEINRYVRSEVRRRRREAAVFRQKSVGHDDAHHGGADVLSDFLATLSPPEQRFCHEFLMQSPEDGLIDGLGPAHLSSANVWQRTRRLYLKMLDFLGIKE